MASQEITPEQLIDTSENKPIVDNNDEQEQEHEQQEQIIHQIALKKISQLTKDEKDILINNAKNNIENDNYNVTFFKNGNYRITKKTPAKESTATKIIRENKGMTNEQLLFEHVINLESQIAILRQKHKNLKRNYKQIYEDVYVDDDEIQNDQPIQQQPIIEQPIQQQPIIEQQYQPKAKARGYRAKLQRLV